MLGPLLHNATRLLRREFERRAREHRLTLLQWRVLAKLADQDGMTQTALANLVEVSAMTLSDIVERLETLGLVRRETDPADSRAKLVWVTPAAQEMVSDMRVIAEQVYDRALDGLDEADRAALQRALTRISANLADDSPAAEEE